MHRPPRDLERGPGVRLQKVLANAGLGSRREIERWIAEGRIRVNGRSAQLGDRIAESDQVELDGRILRLLPAAAAPPLRVIAYNKPEGEVVSRSDPQGRPTVFEHLPKLRSGRWIAVGRLDLNTSGLLLLTTDGELASRLMHPRYGVQREYAVRVLGLVSERVLQQLVHGVELEDGPARFEDIVASGGEGANRWYHVVIREGRQREVRRLWEAVGLRVSRLIRVRFGNVALGSGQRRQRWRELQGDDLRQLLAAADLQDRMPRTSAAQRGGSKVQRNAAATYRGAAAGKSAKATSGPRRTAGTKRPGKHSRARRKDA